MKIICDFDPMWYTEECALKKHILKSPTKHLITEACLSGIFNLDNLISDQYWIFKFRINNCVEIYIGTNGS